MDPAGTFLLVEQARREHRRQTTGPPSAWAHGPPSGPDQSPYQIVTGGRQNWGRRRTDCTPAASTISSRWARGHHRSRRPVGTGTTNNPRGMWTMKLGN